MLQGPGRIRNSASVLPVRVMTCVKGRGSYERFFEYKFIPLGVVEQESVMSLGSGSDSSSGSSSGGIDAGAEVVIGDDENVSASPVCSVGILNALIMPNAICVLVGPGVGVGEGGQVHAQSQLRLQLRSVAFEENEAGYMDLSTDSISGKRKKGARKVQAGHKICKFTFSDGSVQTMLSPISGQVLEVNYAQLAKDPSLVQSQPFGCGFIAVLLPEDDLMPTLESCGAGTGLTLNNIGDAGTPAAAPAPVPIPALSGSAEAACGFFFAKSNLKRDCNSQSRISDRNGWGTEQVGTEVSGSTIGNGTSLPSKSTTDSKGQAMSTVGSSSGSSLSKASACFAFSQNGGCIRGDRCKFAHVVVSDTGSEIILNEHSTGLIGGKRHKKKQRGNEDGDADADGVDGKKKEQGLCFLFQTGKCLRGESCKFVHERMLTEGESDNMRE